MNATAAVSVSDGSSVGGSSLTSASMVSPSPRALSSGNTTLQPTAAAVSPTVVSEPSSDEASAAVVSPEMGCADQLTVGTSVSAESMASTASSHHTLQTKQECWAYLLEGMQLQMASRTTTVWGCKKMYEVYRLSGPATTSKTLEEIREGIHKEFATLYCGSTQGHRVYTTMREGRLYLQINIGKAYDFTDENNRALRGNKKKKKSNEFTFWVTPGSALFAATASRAPSHSPYTKFLMVALDLVLSENSIGNHKTSAQRVGDWSGTEPLDLLQAASAAETGQAVGRFADYASRDTPLCPLQDLQEATAGSMIKSHGNKPKSRLEQSALAVSALAHQATLVAANRAGAVLNHSAAAQEERKRRRVDNLGHSNSTTAKLQKIRWKWTGHTNAGSTCWQEGQSTTDGKDGTSESMSSTTNEEKPLRFKCMVTLQSANIMEGLRELVEAGLTKPSLPDYLRDVPLKGNSTIVVVDGAVETTGLAQV